jgi:predicted enzyme related to lactoylglutathione lyase
VQDPVGSFVSIWQPRGHIGAELVNQPGTFTWTELATSDLTSSRDFYQSVFGWGLDAQASGETAAVFTVGGRAVCGAHAAGEGEFPAWSVWFAVEDCDASAAQVAALGGSVVMAPTDMDFGRGAVAADPRLQAEQAAHPAVGAVFGRAEREGALAVAERQRDLVLVGASITPDEVELAERLVRQHSLDLAAYVAKHCDFLD